MVESRREATSFLLYWLEDRRREHVGDVAAVLKHGIGSMSVSLRPYSGKEEGACRQACGHTHAKGNETGDDTC